MALPQPTPWLDISEKDMEDRYGTGLNGDSCWRPKHYRLELSRNLPVEIVAACHNEGMTSAFLAAEIFMPGEHVYYMALKCLKRIHGVRGADKISTWRYIAHCAEGIRELMTFLDSDSWRNMIWASELIYDLWYVPEANNLSSDVELIPDLDKAIFDVRIICEVYIRVFLTVLGSTGQAVVNEHLPHLKLQVNSRASYDRKIKVSAGAWSQFKVDLLKSGESTFDPKAAAAVRRDLDKADKLRREANKAAKDKAAADAIAEKRKANEAAKAAARAAKKAEAAAQKALDKAAKATESAMAKMEKKRKAEDAAEAKRHILARLAQLG